MSKVGGNKGPRKPQNTMGTLKRLMGYLAHHKLALLIVLLLIIVSSVSLVSGVFFMAPIINNYILPGNFNGLAKVLVILASIFILGALFSYGYARIMVRVSQKCMYRIRTELFNKMQTLPIKYFDGHTNGDLMSLYTNDIESMNEALNNSVGSVMSSSITFVGTLIAMTILNPYMTIITLCVLAGVMFVSKNVAKKSGRYFGMQQMKIAELNGFVEEMIEGQKVVKVFCHEEKAIQDFDKLNESLREASKEQILFSERMRYLENLFNRGGNEGNPIAINLLEFLDEFKRTLEEKEKIK